ncbi:MAG: sugar phosphate isomerase/epimerase family protein [Bryobacteraceae bacterium]
MKIAISNIAWEADENDRVAEIMSARRIKGVEIAPTKIWPDLAVVDDQRAIDLRESWTERGIRIVALQSLLFGRPDLTVFSAAGVRRSMLDYLSGVIRISSLLGAKVLVFGSPKNRQTGGLDPVAAMDIAVEFFSSLAAMAHASGVCIGLEPNPKEYGCDFVRTSQQALELVKRVANPGMGIHLDTAILAMTAEHFEDAVANCFDYLVHVHISEPMLGLVGEGPTDHSRMARALASSGYRNWVSIEMRSGWRTDNTISVERALDFVLQTYAGATETETAIAYGN